MFPFPLQRESCVCVHVNVCMCVCVCICVHESVILDQCYVRNLISHSVVWGLESRFCRLMKPYLRSAFHFIRLLFKETKTVPFRLWQLVGSKQFLIAIARIP